MPSNLPNITTINQYLPDEEYYSLFQKCDALLLLYEDSYNYRESGNVIDAISFDKSVLVYTKKPGIYKEDIKVITFKSLNELNAAIIALKTNISHYSWNADYHSEAEIKSAYKKIFNKLINGRINI